MAKDEVGSPPNPVLSDPHDQAFAEGLVAGFQKLFLRYLVDQAGNEEWREILGQPAQEAVKQALDQVLKEPEFSGTLGDALESAVAEAVNDRAHGIGQSLAAARNEIDRLHHESQTLASRFEHSLHLAAARAAERVVSGRVGALAASQRNQPQSNGRLRALVALAKKLLTPKGLTRVLIGLTLILLVISTKGMLDMRADMQDMRERVEAFQVVARQDGNRRDSTKEAIRYTRPTSEHLNLRDQPDTNQGEVISQLQSSDVFVFLEERETGGITWWHIEDPDLGIRGWASAKYLVFCDQHGRDISQ